MTEDQAPEAKQSLAKRIEGLDDFDGEGGRRIFATMSAYPTLPMRTWRLLVDYGEIMEIEGSIEALVEHCVRKHMAAFQAKLNGEDHGESE